MRLIDRGIVWENPKPYLRSRQAMHPTIVHLGGDEFFCALDIGEAAESMDYRTYKVRSFDGGRSWEFEGRLVPGETARPSTHTIRVSKCGEELIGFGHRAWRDDPEEGVLNRENMGYVPVDLVQVISTDGGESFSPMKVISPPLIGPEFEICHSILELPGGRWLAPTATWRGWDGDLPNGEKTIVLISDDRGQSWPSYGISFEDKEQEVRHWEQSVVALADNRIFAVSWAYHFASGTHRPNRYAISDDSGETFSPSRETGFDGQTCKVCALRDNRLLFVYRRTDKPGLWAQLAEVNGQDIDLAEELPLWGINKATSGMKGGGNNSDELSALRFGFPQIVQVDDTSVMVVFWGYEGDTSKIHWLKIGLDQ